MDKFSIIYFTKMFVHWDILSSSIYQCNEVNFGDWCDFFLNDNIKVYCWMDVPSND